MRGNAISNSNHTEIIQPFLDRLLILIMHTCLAKCSRYMYTYILIKQYSLRKDRMSLQYLKFEAQHQLLKCMHMSILLSEHK